MKTPEVDSTAPPGSRDAARHPEILAPAGDAACLSAALRAGADAIYFGLQEGFNARARAGNFTLAGLPETVAEIHRAGARAYLALNTLVFEPELDFVEHVLHGAAAAGVDAIIVQDPAVALLARELGIEIHASTQMTISSPEGAVFARALGATRAVLPRELSVHEIRTFMAGSDIEVEVFVHGALCVSWSGQCLTSEAWGGRSANRGQCAQSCRMPYDLVLDGEARDLGDVRYLLSPKDLAGARAVPELAALGVHGLKIEGRQKGPQYVATAVHGYRRWLDAIARGEVDSPAAQRDLHADLLSMSLSYTRGFGDGFLAGSDHQSLVEGRFPKHRGVYVGRVVRVERSDVHVALDAGGRPWTGALVADGPRTRPAGQVRSPLPALGGRVDAATGPAAAPLDVRPGMGVVFDAGDPEDKNEPGGPVFRVEKRGQALVLGFGSPGPDLRRVAAGQRVWVTSDPQVARRVEHLLKQDLPRQPLVLTIAGSEGGPLRIEAQSGDHRVHVETASAARPAHGAGLSPELLREKLGAFGGTPYEVVKLDASRLAPGLHVPVSELKAARRDLLTRLEAAVSAGAARPAVAVAKPGELRARVVRASAMPPTGDVQPALLVLCRNDAQLDAVIAAGLPEVELDWMEITGLARAAERARAAGLRVTVATLRVQKPGEESFDARLAKLDLDGVLVRHWGGMVHFARRRDAAPAAPARLRVHGDFSLNVTNSITAQHLFGWGLDTLTASHDLDESQLFALLDRVPATRMTVVVHHRIATFHTEHCVYSHLLSAGRDYRTCGRPCEQHEIGLRDHLGQIHPVIVDAGCRNTVFNSTMQSAARLVPRLLRAGVRRFRVELVRETEAETADIVAAYRRLIAGETTPEAVLGQLGATPQQGVSRQAMQLLR
jgi:putative protease